MDFSSTTDDLLAKMGLSEDPLVKLNDIMDSMPHEELKKLVLLSANRVGRLTKGKEFTDTEDALMHFILGITSILEIYNTASLVTAEPLSAVAN